MLLSTLPLRADEADPLAYADVVTPLGLARLADESGDGQLSAWLGASGRRDLTLVAIRAAPYAGAPERLVPVLAQHLCGRDPVLAPESAHALAQLAERLTPSTLANREALVADLEQAKSALACAKVDDASLRPDLLVQAQVAEAALTQLAP